MVIVKNPGIVSWNFHPDGRVVGMDVNGDFWARVEDPAATTKARVDKDGAVAYGWTPYTENKP